MCPDSDRTLAAGQLPVKVLSTCKNGDLGPGIELSPRLPGLNPVVSAA